MTDISALLQFHFYEKVYYHVEDKHFPSESTEKLGYWVGIAENCGDALTWKILTEDTQKVIIRSAVCSAENPMTRNLRLDSSTGEETPIMFVRS
jgi:hypothetical protein